MKVKESEEMYLETIFIISKRKNVVYSVDIVEEMNYAKSSVSRGVNLLVERGYINKDKKTGALIFTDEGKKKAEKIYERHQIITKSLIKIGVEKSSAEDNACRIEHVITDDIFERIKNFVKCE